MVQHYSVQCVADGCHCRGDVLLELRRAVLTQSSIPLVRTLEEEEYFDGYIRPSRR